MDNLHELQPGQHLAVQFEGRISLGRSSRREARPVELRAKPWFGSPEVKSLSLTTKKPKVQPKSEMLSRFSNSPESLHRLVPRTFLRAMVLTVSLHFWLGPPSAMAQQDSVQIYGAMVGLHQEVPRKAQTWALFLLCNPKWLQPNLEDDLNAVFINFMSFGEALGEETAAVWFWKKGTFDSSIHNVDLRRSAIYCKALGLRPSEGPFILVTDAYPNPKKLPDSRAVIALGNKSQRQIADILHSIADQLAETGPGTGVGAVNTTDLQKLAASQGARDTRLLKAIQAAVNTFGCFAFSFKLGTVESEVKTCK